MPLPALHERFVPAAAKMASTPELSLRGPEGAVAISGRQRRSLYKAAAREKNVAALTAQPLAALPPYGCGVPLAGSERHAGWQWLRHKFSGARPPDLSLRGPEGAVAISGRQRRSLYKAAAREKNVAALPERPVGTSNWYRTSLKREWPPICHCEGASRLWQSREGSHDFVGTCLLSTRVLRDSHVASLLGMTIRGLAP